MALSRSLLTGCVQSFCDPSVELLTLILGEVSSTWHPLRWIAALWCPLCGMKKIRGMTEPLAFSARETASQPARVDSSHKEAGSRSSIGTQGFQYRGTISLLPLSLLLCLEPTYPLNSRSCPNIFRLWKPPSWWLSAHLFRDYSVAQNNHGPDRLGLSTWSVTY
jgi:hypothetical protein